jgi:hypothetical protein
VTVSRTVDCLDLYVWRGHWVLRSRHDTRASLLDALSKVEKGVRPQVRRSTRRVIEFKQPDRPTAARAHREAIADAMAVRAQAMKLYKSSANGTELASIPAEGVIK